MFFKLYVFTYMISALMHNLNLISFQKKVIKIKDIKKLKNNLFKFDERLKTELTLIFAI